MLMKKADGSLRFCLDYRQFNLLTYQDSYPLPMIDSCLRSMGAFTTFDSQSAYWQILMVPVMVTNGICYQMKHMEFKVLPYGLMNSPAVFKRLMDLVIVGLTMEACLVYTDDVIVFTEMFEQHLECLTIIFKHLRQAGLKLKVSKFHILQLRMEFLGFVLSAKGMKPNLEKVRAVVIRPFPQTLKKVRNFLYWPHFTIDISKATLKAQRLHELTKKSMLLGEHIVSRMFSMN